MISENEMKIIQIVREAAGGNDIWPHDEAEVAELNAMVTKWKTNADKRESNTRRINVN